MQMQMLLMLLLLLRVIDALTPTWAAAEAVHSHRRWQMALLLMTLQTMLRSIAIVIASEAHDVVDVDDADDQVQVQTCKAQSAAN